MTAELAFLLVPPTTSFKAPGSDAVTSDVGIPFAIVSLLCSIGSIISGFAFVQQYTRKNTAHIVRVLIKIMRMA